MDNCATETKEWEDAQAKYGDYKEGLYRQVEFLIGFQGLRYKLAVWGKDKTREVR